MKPETHYQRYKTSYTRARKKHIAKLKRQGYYQVNLGWLPPHIANQIYQLRDKLMTEYKLAKLQNQ